MKILTANIALGLKGMDNLFVNQYSHAMYHSWLVISSLTLKFLRGKVGRSNRSERRMRFLKKRDNLDATLRMIENVDPDMLVLAEVVYELHAKRLSAFLHERGYKSVAHGLGNHHEDAHVSVWVAAKEAGETFACDMPMPPYPGHGAGIAGIRLSNGVSLIGVHLALGVPPVWNKQVTAVADLVASEEAQGRSVVVAGDWNHSSFAVGKNPTFAKLSLKTVDPKETRTCPTPFPDWLRMPLDHIFIPTSWTARRVGTEHFGSDHLALLAEVDPQ